MQQKILRKIFVTILCMNFACQKPPILPDPFLVSKLPNIQILERQDHNFCSSLKIDFDKSDNLKSALYWRCRLTMAKYKLSTDKNSPQTTQNNAEISDLITQISLKISLTSESVLIYENKKMDNRQHRQCLAMGYEIATEDQAKIDDYFACRKALIDEQNSFLPFGNNDYAKYPNNSYNIGFAIDQRIDENLKNYNQQKAQYPTCVKFNLHNINFKNCCIAQDNSHQCFGQIEKKKFRKIWEEKIICQKQSYTKFPDEFLKEDDAKKAEIARMKTNSDFYNKYSLSSLGLDEEQFGGEKKNQEEKKEPKKNINSKDHLYSKFELTRLRRQYIFSCQKRADIRVDAYVNELKKSCQDLSNFEIIGEQ